MADNQEIWVFRETHLATTLSFAGTIPVLDSLGTYAQRVRDGRDPPRPSIENRVDSRPAIAREKAMSVAKVTEISASSPTSFEDAIQKGIQRADKTLDKVQGAWISEMKVDVENGEVTAFRVNMKVTFILKG
jgi:flavin-binding protein dodecin